MLESCSDRRIGIEVALLCKKLKDLTMAQLVDSTAAFAERSTKGGLQLYSCNTRGGSPYHVLRVSEELADKHRPDQHGPRCDGTTMNLPAPQRAYPTSTLAALDHYVPALLMGIKANAAAAIADLQEDAGERRRSRPAQLDTLDGLTPQQRECALFFARQNQTPNADPTVKNTDPNGVNPGDFGWQACNRCNACDNHRGCRNGSTSHCMTPLYLCPNVDVESLFKWLQCSSPWKARAPTLTPDPQLSYRDEESTEPPGQSSDACLIRRRTSSKRPSIRLARSVLFSRSIRASVMHGRAQLMHTCTPSLSCMSTTA